MPLPGRETSDNEERFTAGTQPNIGMERITTSNITGGNIPAM